MSSTYQPHNEVEDEFRYTEEETNQNQENETQENSILNFLYDIANSQEAQVAAGIVATGAAIAYNAFTGEDVCLGGVCCTKTDGCHHHHD